MADHDTSRSGDAETRSFPLFSPSLVSLTPFSSILPSSSTRISGNFSRSSGPLPQISRNFAWISLQGRLIGAEEASSAVKIGGSLSPEEAVAWELFSPIHRVLIVTVIAVATARCQKNKKIRNLQRSVEIKDQIMLCMQQKLENMYPLMNHSKMQPETCTEIPSRETEATSLVLQNECYSITECSEVELFDTKLSHVCEIEHEERRMSNLSDWASSSITSSNESQVNSVGIEPYMIENLKRECEEKETKIKELSTLLSASSNVHSKKRIVELEDTVHRKNRIITRLEKDIVILEQKLVEMLRLHRSPSKMKKLPFMADNVIYGMDYTTTSSSSDSDCPPKPAVGLLPGPEKYKTATCVRNRSRPPKLETNHSRKPGSRKPTSAPSRSRQVSPVKERPAAAMNQHLSRTRIKRWV